MEKLTYPLLCYPLGKEAWLGVLIGTNYQVVEKDVRSIKNALADYLFKQYKKHDDYPYANIISPRIKTLEIKVRPTYRSDDGQYPLPTTVKVPVTIVFGENDSDYYECFFPLLDQHFYYYDPKQLKSLAHHFATNILNGMSPEKINRLSLYPKPVLEEVSLKVNYNRDNNWGNNTYQRNYDNLSRYAEKYPYSKAERKRISTFPEAAWELEKTVDEITSRIAGEKSNILIVGESGTGKSAVLKQAFKKLSTKMKKEGRFGGSCLKG